jgi:hypothetical protein
MGCVGISPAFPAIHVGERLAVGVFHFIATGDLLDRSWRREAASAVFRHEAETINTNGPRGGRTPEAVF